MARKFAELFVFAASVLLLFSCDNDVIISRYEPEPVTPEVPSEEETVPVTSILGGLALEGAIFIDNDEEFLLIGTDKPAEAAKVYSPKGIVYDGATAFTDGKTYAKKVYSMSATYILRGEDITAASDGSKTFEPKGDLPKAGKFTGKIYGYYDNPDLTIINLYYVSLFKDITGSAEVAYITFNYNSAKYWLSTTEPFDSVYTGAIAQRSTVTSGSPKFTNLRLKGTVTIKNPLPDDKDVGVYAGGYIGLAEGGVTFTSCSSNIVLTLTGDSVKPFYAGGLVGRSVSSGQFDFTTTDVTCAPKVDCENGTADVYAGGVVGMASGAISGASFSSLKITAISGDGDVYSGGLVGKFDGILTNSTAAAGSAGNTTPPGGVYGSGKHLVYVGGAVGYASSGYLDTVTGKGPVSVWSGGASTVSGLLFPTEGYAGGVVGYTAVPLTACIATSPQVTGRYGQGGTSYAGGVAGGVFLPDGSAIEGCKVTSPRVTSYRDDSGVGSPSGGAAYTGGVAGRCLGVIKGAAVTGTVDISAGCYPYGGITTISAERAVAGGIVGHLEGDYSKVYASIVNGTASTVDARAEGDFAAAGGIAGFTLSGSAIQYSWSAVQVYTRAGKISSPGTHAYAGGIAGWNIASEIRDSFSLSKIEIEVNENPGSAGWAGGIAGLHDLSGMGSAAPALITRCYAGGVIFARTNDEVTKPEKDNTFSGAQAFGGGITGGVRLTTSPAAQLNSVTTNFALQLTLDAVKNSYQRGHRIVGDVMEGSAHQTSGSSIQFSGNLSYYWTRETSPGDRVLGWDGPGNDWDGSTKVGSSGTLLNATFLKDISKSTPIFEDMGFGTNNGWAAATSSFPYPRPNPKDYPLSAVTASTINSDYLSSNWTDPE